MELRHSFTCILGGTLDLRITDRETGNNCLNFLALKFRPMENAFCAVKANWERSGWLGHQFVGQAGAMLCKQSRYVLLGREVCIDTWLNFQRDVQITRYLHGRQKSTVVYWMLVCWWLLDGWACVWVAHGFFFFGIKLE